MSNTNGGRLSPRGSVRDHPQALYGSLRQRVALLPRLSFDLFGDYSRSKPGYTLTSWQVDEKSWSASGMLSYQLVRQRSENLELDLTMRFYNADVSIFGFGISHDRIRTLSAGVQYDTADKWGGIITTSGVLTKGLNIAGASAADSAYISRSGAKPDFTRFEFKIRREQPLFSTPFVLSLSADAQLASGTLYSSEQIGFGGGQFGRAYDPSELTGDQGVLGAIELRYDAIALGAGFKVAPYAVVEYGKLYDKAEGSADIPGASDAGVGFRISSDIGLAIDATVMKPLTYAAGAAQGNTGMSPRYLLRLSFTL